MGIEPIGIAIFFAFIAGFSGSELPDALRALLDLARTLSASAGASVAQRLAANATAIPSRACGMGTSTCSCSGTRTPPPRPRRLVSQTSIPG